MYDKDDSFLAANAFLEISLLTFAVFLVRRSSGTCCQASFAGTTIVVHSHADGLVQERRNSSALAIELCLSSTNPSM